MIHLMALIDFIVTAFDVLIFGALVAVIGYLVLWDTSGPQK